MSASRCPTQRSHSVTRVCRDKRHSIGDYNWFRVVRGCFPGWRSALNSSQEIKPCLPSSFPADLPGLRRLEVQMPGGRALGWVSSVVNDLSRIDHISGGAVETHSYL